MSFQMIGNRTYEQIMQDHKNSQLEKLSRMKKKEDERNKQFRLALLDYSRQVEPRPVRYTDRSYGLFCNAAFDVPGPSVVTQPKSRRIDVQFPRSRPVSMFDEHVYHNGYKPSPDQYKPSRDAFENPVDPKIKGGSGPGQTQHDGSNIYARIVQDGVEVSPCYYHPQKPAQKTQQYKINGSRRRTIFDQRVNILEQQIGPGSYSIEKGSKKVWKGTKRCGLPDDVAQK